MISSSEIKNFTYGLYGAFAKGVAQPILKHAETVGTMIKDTSAYSLDRIIEVVIGLIVMATVLPIGLKEFMKAGNDAVLSSGSVHAVWVIAPVLIVLGLVLGLIYMALGKNNG